MKKGKGHYLFAKICENLLNEVSTVIDPIKKIPGGIKLGQYLHKNFLMPHDTPLQRVQSIELGKDTSIPGAGGWQGGRWYVIAGEHGAAGLSYDNNSREYRLIVPRPKDETYNKDAYSGTDEFIDYTNSSGKNVTNLMKKIIGRTIEIYGGADKSGNISTKQKERQTARAALPKDEISVENAEAYLLKKFKPTFSRVLQNVEQEYKGMLNIMLKGGSYARMDKKIAKLREIDKLNNLLQIHGDFKNVDKDELKVFKRAVENSIILAAEHFYPEQTKGIIKSYGDVRPLDREGIALLINDIKNGDTKKLSAILQFFKNEVLQS